jgi:hypothetical protein
MLEWVPAGLNTGALSGAKASSSRTRDISFGIIEKEESYGFLIIILVLYLSVGAILGQEGNSITSIHITRGP